MDPLAISVLNLSEGEYRNLNLFFRDQPRKQELLAAIRNYGSYVVDYDALSERLGYKHKKSALYTLKHRLTKDLVDFRLNDRKNKYLATKERIQGLRNLLYSKDHPILENELKDLLKRCQQFDIVRGVHEIYFVEFLLSYHNIAQRKKLQEQMQLALEKERIISLCEVEFYRVVFEYQDVFYHGKITPSDLFKDQARLIGEYHDQLQLKTSLFMKLSTRMTFELRLMAEEQLLQVLSPDIHKLFELYITSNVHHRFPECGFALHCLFNKFHLINKNKLEYDQSLQMLDQQLDSVIGLKPYEDVLFYYLFSKFQANSSFDRTENMRIVLDDLFPEKSLGRYSERFMYYLNHLYAIAFLCENQSRRAEGRLLKARSYSKYLQPPAIWIELENSILKLSIHVQKREDDLAAYELNLLSRLLKRPELKRELFAPFVKYTRKHIQAPIRTFIDYREALRELQSATGLLQLINLDNMLK